MAWSSPSHGYILIFDGYKDEIYLDEFITEVSNLDRDEVLDLEAGPDRTQIERRIGNEFIDSLKNYGVLIYLKRCYADSWMNGVDIFWHWKVLWLKQGTLVYLSSEIERTHRI